MFDISDINVKISSFISMIINNDMLNAVALIITIFSGITLLKSLIQFLVQLCNPQNVLIKTSQMKFIKDSVKVICSETLDIMGFFGIYILAIIFAFVLLDVIYFSVQIENIGYYVSFLFVLIGMLGLIKKNSRRDLENNWIRELCKILFFNVVDIFLFGQIINKYRRWREYIAVMIVLTGIYLCRECGKRGKWYSNALICIILNIRTMLVIINCGYIVWTMKVESFIQLYTIWIVISMLMYGRELFRITDSENILKRVTIILPERKTVYTEKDVFIDKANFIGMITLDKERVYVNKNNIESIDYTIYWSRNKKVKKKAGIWRYTKEDQELKYDKRKVIKKEWFEFIKYYENKKEIKVIPANQIEIMQYLKKTYN